MTLSTLTNISDKVHKVLKYNCEPIKREHIDSLIKQWFEAKRDILEAWNGNPIYQLTEPVTFDLNEEEKNNRLDEFIAAIDNMYSNDDLVEFLEEVRKDFFSNRLSKTYYCGDIRIIKGTKIIKAFKHFESDKRVLEDIQNRASMLIQEDKVTGYLCFSVHPLDFLSSSENNYHWRSCHALDGEFRAGNLSYMLDKSTIICYLKSIEGDKVKLPNFPDDVLWNDKKWRMLIFLSDKWNAIMAGRQYPFFSAKALDYVTEKLSPRLRLTQNWSNWYNDYSTCLEHRKDIHGYQAPEVDLEFNDRIVMLAGRLYQMRELVTDCKKPLHYNDLIYSSCYRPYYCWRRPNWWYDSNDDIIHFSIGSEVICPICGQHPIEDSERFCCNECYDEIIDEEKSYCDCCDCQVTDLYYIDGEDCYVCEECFNRHVLQCDKCGKRYYRGSLKYNRETNELLCWHCDEEREEY